MHILIGLVIGLGVATILLITWARGSLFACVFLSLLPAAYVLLACLQQISGGNNFYPGWVLACLGLIGIIWLPRYRLLRAMRGPVYPVYRAPLAPPLPPADPTLLKALVVPVIFLAALTLALTPFFPH